MKNYSILELNAMHSLEGLSSSKIVHDIACEAFLKLGDEPGCSSGC